MRVGVVVRAVLVGLLVLIAGSVPRNLLFAANLRWLGHVPWAAPVTALYVWLLWLYLRGEGPPHATAAERRAGLRAKRLAGPVWIRALLAGGLGLVALVLALRVANRLVELPAQRLPDLSQASDVTVLSLLLVGAPIAGVVEEAAFRGYMQGPIERQWGLPAAILLTGTLFAVVHLDFTPILWPYYLAVAAVYGTVTARTDSILPAVVLHTAGNVYSNLELWLHGRAEWQSPAAALPTIWQGGADASFWTSLACLAVAGAATAIAFAALGRATGRRGV